MLGLAALAKFSSQILTAIGSIQVRANSQRFFSDVFVLLHTHTPPLQTCLSGIILRRGMSLMEICDFGTVLYPFTTINKVLYSVFFFNFSNGLT